MATIKNDTKLHEIAKRLRAEAERWRYYREDDNIFCMDDHEFTEAILEDFGFDDMEMPTHDVFDHMADIVDRPITTRHGKFKTKYGRKTPCCEVCGYSIGDMRWNYCPKCGAVIADD